MAAAETAGRRAWLGGAVLVGLILVAVLLGAGYGTHRLSAGEQTTGLAQYVGQRTGVESVANLDVTRHDWLGDPKIALYSIMLMGFPWIGTISMLIFYAGLQAIPQSVLESAQIDGATGLRRFFSIDFPMILGSSSCC